MSFIGDLKIGSKAEDFVIALFQDAGWTCTKNKDITHDFEAVCGTKSLKFEVKFDKMSASTGNLAIEYYNPKLDKPSGITASKSDCWIFVVPDPKMSAFLVEVPCLLDYINNNKPFRTIDAGGDKNASLYLYKRQAIFEQVFFQIDELTPNMLNALLSTYTDNRDSKNFEKDYSAEYTESEPAGVVDDIPF